MIDYDFQSIDDDVIDLNFVLSDLVEIVMSEAELYELAKYNALSSTEHDRERRIPIGKVVY